MKRFYISEMLARIKKKNVWNINYKLLNKIYQCFDIYVTQALFRASVINNSYYYRPVINRLEIRYKYEL